MRRRTFTPRQRRFRKTIGWIMIFASFAVGVWAIAEGLHTHSRERPVSGGVQTTGTVIGYRPVQEWEDDYSPVVAFTDANGQRIVFSAPALRTPPMVGSVVSVSYDPQQPTTAHDLSDTALWRLQLYVGLFAIAVCLSMVLLIGWLARRNRTRLRR
jgi:hypothetical protein